ncbi:hypothetical protein SPURM210S_06689 [Streptomyces purpurascens]
MKHSKVGALMTADVVRAEYGTPFKEVARLLGERRISGLPVVDDDEKVLGVMSETDVMARKAVTRDPSEPRRLLRRPRWTPGSRARRAKAQARTAGQLMSRPAITVHSEATVVEAARVMAQHRVERLPVVDEDERLVGIVTRRDLLEVFLRPDAEIREAIRNEVLGRALWLPPDAVDVDVREGVVTLTGQLAGAACGHHLGGGHVPPDGRCSRGRRPPHLPLRRLPSVARGAGPARAPLLLAARAREEAWQS